MVNFATLTNQCFFDFYKIANLRALSQLSSGTQTGKGSYITVRSNLCIFNVTVGFDTRVTANLAVNNDAVRLDNDTVTESYVAFKYAVDVDHYIATEFYVTTTIETRRIQ